jgi:putative RecB family exonuclease
MAFKFSAIDRLAEQPSPWTVKGTIVHLALERLHADVPSGARTPDAADTLVVDATADILGRPECEGLDVGDHDLFVADAQLLARNAFLLEDPNQVQAIGLELKLEAEVDGVVLRGIIDRLDLRPDGSLVVVDYKTGRAPRRSDERARLTGVHLYASLIEQSFGVVPASVELLHLREPLVLSSTPTDRSRRGLRQKTSAIWTAIERACASDGFQARPSGLCSVCGYQAICPAWVAPGAAGAAPGPAPDELVAAAL